MATNDFSRLVEPQFKKELTQEVPDGLREIQKLVIDISGNLKGLTFKLGGAKAAKELRDTYADLNTEIGKLTPLIGAYSLEVAKAKRIEEEANRAAAQTKKELAAARGLDAKAAREEIKLTQASETATRKKAAADLGAADSTKSLRNELKNLTEQYDKLSKAERANAGVGGAQLKKINDLRKEISTIEFSQGNFRSNVGNYANNGAGLGRSLQGILREVPSVQSLDQFFLAASNQAPQLADEIENVSKSLKELKSQLAAAEAAQVDLNTTAEQTQVAYESTTNSLYDQVDAAVDNLQITDDQKAALKEQIAAQIESAATTIESAEAAGLNTESLLANAGATVEDSAAIGANVTANGQNAIAHTQAAAAAEAQTVATSQLTAAMARAGTVAGTFFKSLFSPQTLLLAGIFLLTTYGAEAATAFGKAIKGAKGAQDEIEATNKVLDQAGDAAADAYEDIYSLNTAFELAAKGVISEEKALNQFNSTIKLAKGEVTSFNEAQQWLIDHSEEYIDAMLKQAAATLAYEQAAQQAVEQQRLLRNGAQDNTNFFEDLLLTFSGVPKGVAQVSKYTNALKENSEALQENLDIGNTLKQQFEEAAGKLGLADPNAPNEKKPKKEKSTLNDDLDREAAELKVYYDTLIADLQPRIAALQEVLDNENSLFQERIKARKELTGLLVMQEGYGGAAEMQALHVRLDEIARIEKKAFKDRTEAEQELIKDKKLLGAQLNLLQIQLDNTQADIIRKGGKAITDLIKENEAAIKAGIDAQVAEIAKNIAPLEKIQEKFAFDLTARQLDRIDELSSAYVGLGQSIGDVFGSFSQRRLQDLDAELESLQKISDFNLKRIDFESISEEEKEKKKRDEVDRTEAARKQIEERKRREQIRADRFQKASTVAAIIQSTALAVIRALGSQPFTPANIALAAAVGATGAAQLAVALSAPAPQYFKGTGKDGHKADGMAIVHGKELVIDKDGVMLTGGGIHDATPMWLNKGAHVIPHDLTQQILGNINFGGMSIGKNGSIEWGVLADRTSRVGYETGKKLDRIEKAILATGIGGKSIDYSRTRLSK